MESPPPYVKDFIDLPTLLVNDLFHNYPVVEWMIYFEITHQASEWFALYDARRRRPRPRHATHRSVNDLIRARVLLSPSVSNSVNNEIFKEVPFKVLKHN